MYAHNWVLSRLASLVETHVATCWLWVSVALLFASFVLTATNTRATVSSTLINSDTTRPRIKCRFRRPYLICSSCAADTASSWVDIASKEAVSCWAVVIGSLMGDLRPFQNVVQVIDRLRQLTHEFGYLAGHVSDLDLFISAHLRAPTAR